MRIKKSIFRIAATAAVAVLLWGAWAWRRHRAIAADRHPPVFHYSIPVAGTDTGTYLLLTPYQLSRWQDGQIIVMDMTGSVLLQKTVRGAPFCLRDHHLNGHHYYNYLIDDHNTYHIPKIGMAAGCAVLADSTLHEIARFHLLPYGDITTNRNEGLDLHDLILLSPNHYIALAVCEIHPKNIPAELKPAKDIVVSSPVIQEVENGKVIWQWIAADHPELFTASEEGNNYADTAAKHDYLHVNSLYIDPADSNLICSFRHSNQVVKIDHKTGALIWKLGGNNSDFSLTAESTFLKQHDATYTNEHNLLLFDNGDTVRRKSSRILELALDEQRHEIKTFKAYPTQLPFALFMGSVEKWGDTLLIGGGTGNYIQELEISTGRILFEMRCNLALYRVYLTRDIRGLVQSRDQAVILDKNLP